MELELHSNDLFVGICTFKCWLIQLSSPFYDLCLTISLFHVGLGILGN